MTEIDPGAGRPNAGSVGVHRQDVSEPVTEQESLNAVRQSRPGPEPVEAARDTETKGKDKGKGHDEIAEVRQEIERTRDDLGDTIEALAAKADLKARAQERVHATTAAARARVAGVAGRVREATPEPVRGVAGRVGEEARRRPGVLAAAGVAGTGLLMLRRFTRSQGRTARPGMSGMFQKSGVSGKASRTRGAGGARMGRGILGGSGKTGKPLGGSRMFGAKSRTGGVGPLGGKGAFGGKRAFGGIRKRGGRRTLGGFRMSGGAGLFGRKGMTRGRGMRGVFGRGGLFGGGRMFPRSRHTLMRRFAHR
ncbi:hypothetical protein GCM10010116_38930 [Microbispora rosea subsp. aerata]|nr:DUF3618 domain-containing protein [Microbispora rosea]GGO19347.1 hypothetical protein GCM10010116_38930 [Microbispora rosea subsp. aerata]GIH54426.1 hypothetical protein Mro02_13400 [Microbispora rosea subsp. aerata]GLJ81398.1 hypothetical protein GCM10017588_01210 [Microbispora rosea subsp. aerata]